MTSILQTRDGYLWIGTSNGLARFDGLRFTAFKTLENPELHSNRILSLYQDRTGTLWIGTANGGLTEYRDGRFESRSGRSGLSSEEVLCGMEDGQGRLWVGTGYGINRWDDTRFHAFFGIDGLPDDRIQAIACAPDGKLILGTQKGLAQQNGPRFAPCDVPGNGPRGNIHSIVATRRGELWVSGTLGVWAKPRSSESWTVCSDSGTALLERASGAVLAGSVAGTLQEFTDLDARPRTVFHVGSPITALFEDREGTLWVGTAGEGLRRLKPVQIRLTALPPPWSTNEAISSLARLPNGELWLASSSGEVRQWTGDRLLPLPASTLPPGAQARVLCSDREGALWIGTRGDGLFRWKNGGLEHWNQIDHLSDSDIRALHVASDGTVWVGTANGGLNRLRSGKVQRFATPWGFGGASASVIKEDPNGSVWIGTGGDGLYRLQGESFQTFSSADGIFNGDIRALLTSDPGEVWVGTAGGLVLIRHGQVKVFTIRDGLPEDEICQLQDDDQGNLWIGSGSGIARLRKSQLREYASGTARFLDPVPYGKPDGLPALECFPGATLDEGGRAGRSIWLATSKGLVTALPRQLLVNRVPPPVVIEQLLIENNPVPLAGPIRVPPGRESIQAHFTALSLVAPEKVRFRCRLLGFDRDWIDVGASRTMRYTRVPPARYELRVLASNNDGVWNETGASLVLVVGEFWWEALWFRLAAGGAVLGLIASWVRMQRVRRRELDNLRLRLAGDLHDEVGSSLWSIALLSQMLQKRGEMGEEERREVSEIHRIATQTSNAVRDIVWLINPAYDTLEDLVLRMQDFAGTVLRGIDHRVSSSGLDPNQRLPLSFRQNLFLMFKEAVTNVAKHAHATQVEIQLQRCADSLHLIVRDNGVGFDPDRITCGNGLRNLRNRADKLHGSLRVQSIPHQQTILHFEVPHP